MRYIRSLRPGLWLAAFISLPFALQAQEEETFEYNVGEVNWFTGEGVEVGGVLTPSLWVLGTAGIFDDDAGVGDFAFSEHDPQLDASIQAIEVHLDLNFNDVITGRATGFGHEGEEEEWEAELEEAFLHFHLNDNLAIGGGQFLNEVGFQSSRHIHAWEYVNQNLVNTRILNEGEMITQGGELLLRTPGNSGLLTLALGGARVHAHEHEEEEGEEEEHHLEIDESYFNDWVFSLDYKFRLPADPSMKFSTSFLAGENGFGKNTFAYGAGLQKVWNGHDHGDGGPDFCSGAFMVRTEFLGRVVEAVVEHEDEDEEEPLDIEDFGVSSGIFYGINDWLTASVRHDWLSEVEEAELADIHRISPALTAYWGPQQRIQTRIQYDYIDRDDRAEGEHAAWFQVQLQWGGEGGPHQGHSH